MVHVHVSLLSGHKFTPLFHGTMITIHLNSDIKMKRNVIADFMNLGKSEIIITVSFVNNNGLQGTVQ